MGNSNQPASKETDWLLSKAEDGATAPDVHYSNDQPRHYRHGHQTSSDDVFRDYQDLGVAVVENEDHEPIVVHDLSGPVLAEFAGLERSDSIVSSILSEPVDVKAVLAGEHEALMSPQVEGAGPQQATISQEVASMAKNLIGCGALSLCNGIALCANEPKAIVAAVFWIAVMGILFGYFCWLIAKVCEITKRSTYRGIWQETVGHRGALAVSIANTLKALMADLAYATILADTLQSLFAAVHWQVSRLMCLILVTVFGILPLCLLKNLAVLAPFSVIGTAGMLLTTAVMAIRYLDGSYREGGAYHDDLPDYFQPSFGNVDKSWSLAILPFVCMVFEAYVMHYNSPRFYFELKDKSLPRFSIAVSNSFAIAGVLYAGIASFGFLTFGGNSAGFILNNYSPHDPLAVVSRVAVGLSTLVAYPIVFMGVKDGILDIFEVPLQDQTPQKLNQLTYGLLSILTVISIFITDLGLINAVGGGLVSTAITFCFPAIMYHMAAYTMPGEALKVIVTSSLAVFGMILGLIGVYIAISGALSS